MWQRISLSQTTRATKISSKRTIIQNRKLSSKYTKLHPAPPSLPETHPFQQIKSFPTHMIISLFYIQFTIVLFNLLSKHSLAIRIESKICRSPTKEFWDSEMWFSKTSRNLLAKTLANSFYKLPNRLISQKSFIFTALCFFGIKVGKEALSDLLKTPCLWKSEKKAKTSPSTILQHLWKNAIMKPSRPGALFPVHSYVVSMHEGRSIELEHIGN